MDDYLSLTMMNISYSVITILLVSCVCFHSFAQPKANNDKILITNARASSNEAFKKHDYVGIGKTLIQSVTVISASGQVVTGKDAVLSLLRKRFQQMPDLYYLRTPDVITISETDTLAWESGRWSAHNKGIVSSGNYSAVWCKRKGVWLIRSEQFVPIK